VRLWVLCFAGEEPRKDHRGSEDAVWIEWKMHFWARLRVTSKVESEPMQYQLGETWSLCFLTIPPACLMNGIEMVQGTGEHRIGAGLIWPVEKTWECLASPRKPPHPVLLSDLE